MGRPLTCRPTSKSRSDSTNPRTPSLLLLRALPGDDLVLDAVVGRLRDHLLGDQLVLSLVGAVLDDGVGISVADSLERHQLVLLGAVDVDQLGLAGLLRGLLGGCLSEGGKREHAGEQRTTRVDHPNPLHFELLRLNLDPVVVLRTDPVHAAGDLTVPDHLGCDHRGLAGGAELLVAGPFVPAAGARRLGNLLSHYCHLPGRRTATEAALYAFRAGCQETTPA